MVWLSSRNAVEYSCHGKSSSLIRNACQRFTDKPDNPNILQVLGFVTLEPYRFHLINPDIRETGGVQLRKFGPRVRALGFGSFSHVLCFGGVLGV